MYKIAQIIKLHMSFVFLITIGMILLYPAQASTFPQGEIEGTWKGTLYLCALADLIF